MYVKWVGHPVATPEPLSKLLSQPAASRPDIQQEIANCQERFLATHPHLAPAEDDDDDVAADPPAPTRVQPARERRAPDRLGQRLDPVTHSYGLSDEPSVAMRVTAALATVSRLMHKNNRWLRAFARRDYLDTTLPGEHKPTSADADWHLIGTPVQIDRERRPPPPPVCGALCCVISARPARGWRG